MGVLRVLDKTASILRMNEADYDRTLKQVHGHLSRVREEIQTMSGMLERIDERTSYFSREMERAERRQDQQDRDMEKLKERMDAINVRVTVISSAAGFAVSAMMWLVGVWDKLKSITP